MSLKKLKPLWEESPQLSVSAMLQNIMPQCLHLYLLKPFSSKIFVE